MCPNDKLKCSWRWRCRRNKEKASSLGGVSRSGFPQKYLHADFNDLNKSNFLLDQTKNRFTNSKVPDMIDDDFGAGKERSGERLTWQRFFKTWCRTDSMLQKQEFFCGLNTHWENNLKNVSPKLGTLATRIAPSEPTVSWGTSNDSHFTQAATNGASIGRTSRKLTFLID